MSILLFDQIDRLFGSFACNLARQWPALPPRDLPVDIASTAFIPQDFAMTDRFALRQPDDQLLGEMQTEIATPENDAADIFPLIRPGEKVYFEPGPVESESTGARRIRVENGDGELLGHLPPDPADWLWPLLAADKIRLEGYVPVATSPGGVDDSRRLAIVLTVYQTDGGDLLHPLEPANEWQLAHELVRHAYTAAHQHLEPAMMVRLAHWLNELPRAALMPKTRLLLALLPGLIHEMRACDGMGAIVAFRGALAKLSIGEPVTHGALTFFPLVWTERVSPAWTTLAAALTNGTAELDNSTFDHAPPAALHLVSHSSVPILVNDGEEIASESGKRVISRTVLVPPATTLQLNTCSCEEWRDRRAPHENSDSPSAAATFDLSALNFSTQTTGVIIAAGPQFLSIELFALPEAFHSAWRTIAASMPIASSPTACAVSLDGARTFLDQLAGAARAPLPSAGLGCDIEIAADGLAGRGLLHDGTICQLTAATHARESRR